MRVKKCAVSRFLPFTYLPAATFTLVNRQDRAGANLAVARPGGRSREVTA